MCEHCGETDDIRDSISRDSFALVADRTPFGAVVYTVGMTGEDSPELVVFCAEAQVRRAVALLHDVGKRQLVAGAFEHGQPTSDGQGGIVTFQKCETSGLETLVSLYGTEKPTALAAVAPWTFTP